MGDSGPVIEFGIRSRYDTTATQRLVVNGRVFCPRRGSVDVLVCFACREGRGLTAGHQERVVCALVDGDPAERPRP